MKQIEIFVIGKYEYKSDLGTWIYYLNYKKAVIKRSGYINHAGSPNRTALVSLYMALQQVKEPCEIVVHSKAALGFKKPKQSSNKDLIVKIQTLINKVGHIVVFDTTDDFGRVNIWEQVYGTKSPNIKPKNLEERKEFKPNITPNDVFEHNKGKGSWKDMYSDLMDDSDDKWVPGSGGY